MERPLSTVLFFLFPGQFLEINFSVIPFILCTYSSLTPSSKLWANSGIKISLSLFQSCRNTEATEMSWLVTTNLSSCAATPFHGKITRFPSITHASAPWFCVSLRWLKWPSHSVLIHSLYSSVIIPKSQSNNLSNRTNWFLLADQASSVYLSSSQLEERDSWRLTLKNGTCCFRAAIRLVPISCALYLSNAEISSMSRLDLIPHTKLRKTR